MWIWRASLNYLHFECQATHQLLNCWHIKKDEVPENSQYLQPWSEHSWTAKHIQDYSMQLCSSRNGMDNYSILNIQKKAKNLRAWPWKCAERNGKSDRHTLTQEHTHMPFSTFQYTFYTTWLSWTLTLGNVTEKVKGELILVTAHCPVFASDF
jgi:hypothetical protein